MTSGISRSGGSSWWLFGRGTTNALSGWQKEVLQLLGQQQFEVFLKDFQDLEKAIPSSNKQEFEEKVTRIAVLIFEKRANVLANLKKGTSVQAEDINTLREQFQILRNWLSELPIKWSTDLETAKANFFDTLGMLGDPLHFSQSITDQLAGLIIRFPSIAISGTGQAVFHRTPRLVWSGNEGRIVGGGAVFQGNGCVARMCRWRAISPQDENSYLEWEAAFYIPTKDRLGIRIGLTVPENPQQNEGLKDLFNYVKGYFEASDPGKYEKEHPYTHAQLVAFLYRAINDALCLLAALAGDIKREENPSAREQFAFLYCLYLRSKTYLEEENDNQLKALILQYFSCTDATDMLAFLKNHQKELNPFLFFLMGDEIYRDLWSLKKKSGVSIESQAALNCLSIDPDTSYPEELFRLWKKHHEALFPIVQNLMGEKEFDKYLERRLRVLRCEGAVATANAAFFWNLFTRVPKEGEPSVAISDFFGLLPWYERIGRLGTLTDEECQTLDLAVEDLNKRELVLWIIEASERLKTDKIKPLQAFLDRMTDGNQAVVRKFMEAELGSAKRTDFVRVFPTLAEMEEKGISVDATPDAIKKFTNQEFQKALQWVAEGMKEDTDPTTIAWYVERIMAYNSIERVAIQKSNQLMEMIIRLNKIGKLSKDDHVRLYERLQNEKTWNGIRRFLSNCEKTKELWVEYDSAASSDRWMGSFIEFIRYPTKEGVFPQDDFFVVQMEEAPTDDEGLE